MIPKKQEHQILERSHGWQATRQTEQAVPAKEK
jgi:hypothetical protein